MELTELNDSLIGAKVHIEFCSTNSESLEKCEGEIAKEDGHFFLLQNHKAGSWCKDKKGYMCSWGMGNGKFPSLLGKGNNIGKITLINQNNIHELW